MPQKLPLLTWPYAPGPDQNRVAFLQHSARCWLLVCIQFWPSFGRDLHPILTHVYTPILLWGAGDVRSDRRSVTLDFIHRGKPVENGFVESFNGRLRDECLNANQFSPSTRSPDSGNEDNGP